jgi:hypothetical protein
VGGGGIETRTAIDLPDAVVPAGAIASASFRFDDTSAGPDSGPSAGANAEAREAIGANEAMDASEGTDASARTGGAASGTDREARLEAISVTDARGRALAAWVKPSLDESPARFTLVVESEGAVFPLTAVLTLTEASADESGAKRASPDGGLATGQESGPGPAPGPEPGPPSHTAFEPLTGPPADAPLAAPANDDCTGAITIPNSQLQVLTAPVDVMDASIIPDPLFCVTADRSIWYIYTAPATGTYTITTCAAAGALSTTMPDTALTIMGTGAGCLAPGLGIACNDDDPSCSGGKQSTIVTTLTGGQSYYIVAARYAGLGATPPVAEATSIQILIARGSPNDSCAGTVPSLTLDIPTTGTTLTATNDYQLFTGVPNGYQLPGPPLPVGQTVSAASGRDTVYAFTAPATGAYSFRITGYSPMQNAVLYVSSECPSGTPPVTVGAPPCVGAANRTAGGGTAEEVMCVPMSAGQTEYVIVDDAVASNVGSAFRLEVNACVRENEPNNTPATANPLACPVEGSMNPANTADFYALGTPPAGSRLFAISDGVPTTTTISCAPRRRSIRSSSTTTTTFSCSAPCPPTSPGRP